MAIDNEYQRCFLKEYFITLCLLTTDCEYWLNPKPFDGSTSLLYNSLCSGVITLYYFICKLIINFMNNILSYTVKNLSILKCTCIIIFIILDQK